jgi:UV DNA damage endonuclease
MSIGYACLAVGVPNTDLKGCLLRNVTEQRLADLIRHNLRSLSNIVDYNSGNGIRLFRISSDVIPFGSSPANTLPWRSLFQDELARIGNGIKEAHIRVSMHPGQYTVLNSPDRQVVERAIDDLAYHASFLDSLGVDGASKIILHVGGVYRDKHAAMKRFAERYRDLDNAIKRRLVVENDDRSYHIGDVLELGSLLGIPVVYDNLHNKVNSCDLSKDDACWIAQCLPSWGQEDGRQKIHYAQQDRRKSAGAHSETIAIAEFLQFHAGFGVHVPDIMLEVKDKNLSAVKCINCTAEHGDRGVPERDWSRYAWAVLERSPGDYETAVKLLEDKSSYPAVALYQTIEHAYTQDVTTEHAANAALHAWSHLESVASAREKERLLRLVADCREHGAAIVPAKRFLLRLAAKYGQEDVVSSYYFL